MNTYSPSFGGSRPSFGGSEPDYEEMLRKRTAKKNYEDYMAASVRGQLPNPSIPEDIDKQRDLGYAPTYPTGVSPRQYYQQKRLAERESKLNLEEQRRALSERESAMGKPDLGKIMAESQSRVAFNKYLGGIRKGGITNAPEYNKIMSQAFKNKPSVTAQSYWANT